MYNLLLKTHKITGLKYLCFHKGDNESCHKYKGSGTRWKNHLGIHGFDEIETEILMSSENLDELSEYSIKLSKEWNIVKDINFANLVIEDCGIQHLGNDRKVLYDDPNWVNPRKGKTGKEIYGEEWVSPLKGKTVEEIYKNGKSDVFTGRTMQEITGNPHWRNDRKGKTGKEIYGEDWVNPLKGSTYKETRGEDYIDPRIGKTMKEIYGNDYVHPNARKVEIILPNGESLIYDSTSELRRVNGLSQYIADMAKSDEGHTFKRASRSTKNNFIAGDTIYIREI